MEMETTTTAACTAQASAAAPETTTTGGALPVTSHDLQLPPGFRFHPTDEELVVHYLTRKLASHSFKPIPIVTEVDLYKFDPWELPQQAAFGEKEWYFFSPRDRKYPNGVRPNRAAASGYWKATGTDKIIYSSTDGRKIGVKKALVFYKGRAPKGVKSNWIMHEYRLVDASNKALSVRKKGSLRLDDWVLCRIYKKKAKAHNRASTKSENTRKNNQSFDEDILAALPEIDDAKLSFPQLGGSMNKFMDQNDSFMQVLLSGGHGLSMNQLSALDLLQRNRQTPTTTEMLFPTTTLSKDGIWQFGGILDQRKDDMSLSPSQQSTSLALLDSLRQQQHAGRAGLIHEDFQRDFRNQQHLAYAGQQQHEVVDESFTRNTPILFPPAAHLNFNNSFTLHSGAY